MHDNEEYIALICELQKVSFVLVELQLYLATHPDDEKAVTDFNRFSALQMHLKHVHESKFGPLLQYGYSPVNYPSGWVENPWPWEL